MRSAFGATFGLLVLLVGTLIPTNLHGAPPNRATLDEKANEEELRLREEQQKKEVAQYVKHMDYLENVLGILHNTEQFQDAMKAMNQDDIRSGKIAHVVDKLDPQTIKLLTKAKVTELERLGQEMKQSIENNDKLSEIETPEHIDYNDWTTFSTEDLRKLIVKTVKDMDQLENRRKENFKEYEMKKEAERDHFMQDQLNEAEKQEYIRKMNEQKQRHDEHERVKHPGSRDQLEEVWEEGDKLDKDSYDSRTLFGLHDLDGDGFWSYDELNTIFQTELDKLYNVSDPNVDPNEKMEEMYRMREHVMNQMDKDKDRRISLAEFLADTEAQEQGSDKGWEDINDQKIYTDEELQQFKLDYAKQQGWDAISTPNPATAAHNPPSQHDSVNAPASNVNNNQDLHVEEQQKEKNLPPVVEQQGQNIESIERSYGI